MDPLLYIERGLSYHARKNIGRLLFVWSLLFLSLSMTSMVLALPLIYTGIFEFLFLFSLSLYMANALAKFFFLHLYKERLKNKKGLSHEVIRAREAGRLHKDDVKGFINSPYGDETMKRLGMRRESLEDYIATRMYGSRLPDSALDKEWIDLSIYVLILHDNDEHFASYLRNQRITRNDLLHGARLVHNIAARDREQERFWSRTTLHELSPFELDVVNIEEAYDVYFTSQVIRNLSTLSDDEKLKIFRRIIGQAKHGPKKDIMIADIHPDNIAFA